MNNISNTMIELFGTAKNIEPLVSTAVVLLVHCAIGQLASILGTWIEAYIYPTIEHAARMCTVQLINSCPPSVLEQYSDTVLETNVAYASESLEVGPLFFENVVPQVGIAIYTLIEVFKRSSILGLLSLCSVLIYCTVMYWFCSQHLVPNAVVYGTQAGKRTTEITECMRNKHVRYLYEAEAFFEKRVEQVSNQEKNYYIHWKLIGVINLVLRESMFLILPGIAFNALMLYLMYKHRLPFAEGRYLAIANMSIMYAMWGIGNSIQNLVQSYSEGQGAVELLRNLYEQQTKYYADNHNKKHLNNIEHIELRNLTIKYRDHIVIDKLNLKLHAGQKVLCIGPSGCGKSTLAKVLAGLNPHYEGEVYINGKMINDYNADTIKSFIVFITQGTEIVDDTIYNNISLGSTNISHAAVQKLANYLELPDIDRVTSSTTIDALSGGQKKRISFARGIERIENEFDPENVQQPTGKLIICDEATSNLDTHNAHKVMQILNRVSRRCITMIIEHSQQNEKEFDFILRWVTHGDTYRVVVEQNN